MSELPDPAALPLFASSQETSEAPVTPGRRIAHTTAGTPKPTARRTSGAYDPAQIDWSIVAGIRTQASEQLTARSTASSTSAQQRELGRAIILELLEDHARSEATAGRAVWDAHEQEQYAKAVFDSVFGLGRLQVLVDNNDVENVIIIGNDNVTLETVGGERIKAAPIASSDAELIEMIQFIASRSDNPRPFSEAQTRLHMKLDGGLRLAASAWVNPRPQVVIRRSRVHRATLDGMVEMGSLTPSAANFLDAAVKARKSIVVAGPQGAGKTTLLRALCDAIPTTEAIGTFETEYELLLHELGDDRIVHAWESRPGSGEVSADGRAAGEFTMAEALYDSFRFNLDRQIVGEIRGWEILVLIKAMQSGSGSISTTHASSADATIEKLITCALEAGPNVSHDYAQRSIVSAIDIVVQLHLRKGDGRDRPTERWVSEIIAVEQGERAMGARGYATQPIFKSDGTGPARPVAVPESLNRSELIHHGFDTTLFTAEGGQA